MKNSTIIVHVHVAYKMKGIHNNLGLDVYLFHINLFNYLFTISCPVHL